jgi:ABC-type phosphate transport system ATPase subunit
VGEQQRVMFARALALDPDALLLDEPTSALDETARDEIERTLRNLRERVSIVLVTHDRGQAERLTDRTVEIRDGRAR